MQPPGDCRARFDGHNGMARPFFRLSAGGFTVSLPLLGWMGRHCPGFIRATARTGLALSPGRMQPDGRCFVAVPHALSRPARVGRMLGRPLLHWLFPPFWRRRILLQRIYSRGLFHVKQGMLLFGRSLPDCWSGAAGPGRLPPQQRARKRRFGEVPGTVCRDCFVSLKLAMVPGDAGAGWE